MAIAVEGTPVSVQGAAVSSLTIPTSAAGGSDRFCFVGIFGSGDSARSVSSVVRGGSENFTQKFSVLFDGDTSVVEGWHFIAPAASTATIVVTFGQSQNETCAGAVYLSGVHQTTPLGSAFTASALDGGPMTVNVTGTANDELVIDAVGGTFAGFNVGAGQTPQWEQENINGGASGCSSTEPGNGGTVTMSWTSSGAGFEDKWGIGAAAIKPAAAAGGTILPQMMENHGG